MEVFALREFNLLFILLDCIWLIFLFCMLRIFNRRQALKVGLIGGVLYFLVDYGIFYLLLGTRQVTGGDPFWVLAWMSMSYGFTNFTWIWLMLDRDTSWVEWTVLIVSAWLAVALLSQNFGANLPAITTGRGTLGYHAVDLAIPSPGETLLFLCDINGHELVVNIKTACPMGAPVIGIIG